jgi:dihydroorotate dehydrogenase electron transfer subunit
VAGGLGVAPMPILTQLIKSLKKKFVTYIGARTNNQVVDRYLENVFIATDDGSRGSRGTVVDILEKELAEKRYPDPKIFACGPTKMLNNLFRLVKKDNIPCEVSLEGVMACGVGICQGCPVELADDEKRYALMCKDGPVFDIHSLRMPINGFA